MKTFQKHHYADWKPPAGEASRLTFEPGDVHSTCTRCKIPVKIGKQGGLKFWLGGRWVSKRPACQVSEGP